MDIRSLIHPRHHLVQKPLLSFVIAIRRLELRNPDWASGCNIAHSLDVRLEVRGVVSTIIPMDGDEVDGAFGALPHEGAQPTEARVGCVGGVGDGRGA